MKLLVRTADMSVSEPVAFLNSSDCLEMGVGPVDRVRITGSRETVTSVIVSDSAIPKGTAAMTPGEMQRIGVREGDTVSVVFAPMPDSARSVRRKINGMKLGSGEMESIVNDIYAGNLSEKEILAFVSAFNVNNSDLTEIAYLTRAMTATGRTVDLGVRPVFDFHSLGGIPGNKITPIVVSIVASAGLIIPKMSSRAVSSACGTSDFVDTFCDVEMDAERLKSTVAEFGGVFACGNDDYAPVGRMIIDAERPLGIDPRPTMMASIMSKKLAVGTTHLLVDIPVGRGTKVPDIASAESFAGDLIGLGTVLGIHVECAATYADQPLGTSVGPVLEAKECIGILENGGGDPNVVDKACSMAGILLEMAGEKDGKARAEEILRSGEAHRKFMQIAVAQNGSPGLRSSDLTPGRFVREIHAKRSGIVQYVDNTSIKFIAKAAGAPGDIGAGVEILHRKGDGVVAGESLFRIYAENQAKLDRAVESARSRRPMKVDEESSEGFPGEMVLERIPPKRMLDLIRFRHGDRWSEVSDREPSRREGPGV